MYAALYDILRAAVCYNYYGANYHHSYNNYGNNHNNSMTRAVIEKIAAALLVAACAGGLKLYADVQVLKAKFEFVNGHWRLP